MYEVIPRFLKFFGRTWTEIINKRTCPIRQSTLPFNDNKCLKVIKSKAILNRKGKPLMLSFQNPMQMECNSWLISSQKKVWSTGHGDKNKSDGSVFTFCMVRMLLWV